ncbi:MAG: M28 family peptidase [Pseudomonadota bacterium]
MRQPLGAVAIMMVVVAACGGATPNSSDASHGHDEPHDTLEIVKTLSADEMQGRLVGTEGNAKARAYLIDQMRQRSLPPLAEDYGHAFSFQSRIGETREGVNLIAKIDGTADATDKVMVVTAHYDHVGMRGEEIYNGADDNASGVAGALAIADHFLEEPPLHDVVIALLDAEEGGLHGARAFMADAIIVPDKIALNINLDMLSKNDRNELYAAGAYHTPALEPILRQAGEEAPVILKLGHDDPALGPNDWTLQSDHGPFHMAGIPFVYFGVEDHPDYHQPTDVFETIPQDFFLGAVQTVVTAADLLDEEMATLAVE